MLKCHNLTSMQYKLLGGRNYAKYTDLKYVHRSMASQMVNFKHKVKWMGCKTENIANFLFQLHFVPKIYPL